MQKQDIRVVKAIATGDETTLLVQGKSAEGAPQKGEVIMKLENGKWIMRNEKWKGI